jgi:ribosomal protein L34E
MVTKKTTAKKTPAATPAKKVTPVADKPRLSKPHEIVLSSNTQNAVGILSWSKFAGEADLQELCTDLGKRIDKIKDGDMSSVEAMLFGQAKVLETMFTSLARRAANNDGLKQFQVNLTLALKAQAQCRSTLEALAEIKNPRPVQFVKQANMTTGPQQVNNAYAGTPSHSGIQSRTGNIQSEQNKLLEADHGNYLDTRAQGTAGRVNQTVDAVG